MYQNTYFIANCMIRGSWADVIFPKLVLFNAVFGSFGRNRFKTLKDSTRSSMRRFSPNCNLRDSATSKFQFRGPRKVPLPIPPQTPGGFGMKAAVLNQRSIVGFAT